MVVHEVNHVYAVAAVAEVDVDGVVAFDGCAARAVDDTALQINDAQRIFTCSGCVERDACLARGWVWIHVEFSADC